MQFLDAIYKSFMKLNGVVSFIFGLVLTIFVWHFRSTDCIPLYIFTPLVFILFVSIVTLVDALIEEIIRRPRLPSIQRCIDCGVGNNGERKVTLIIEPSQLFAIDSMVSLFVFNDDREIQVGLGYVETIRDRDSKIQAVVFQYPKDVFDEIWKKIIDNNKETLSNLTVKPTVPRSIYFQ